MVPVEHRTSMCELTACASHAALWFTCRVSWRPGAAQCRWWVAWPPVRCEITPPLDVDDDDPDDGDGDDDDDDDHDDDDDDDGLP